MINFIPQGTNIKATTPAVIIKPPIVPSGFPSKSHVIKRNKLKEPINNTNELNGILTLIIALLIIANWMIREIFFKYVVFSIIITY